MSINKTVLVYRNELLPHSETFIKEQILALRDWRAVLVGRKRLNQLPLDNLDVRVIEPASQDLQDRLSWKAHKLVGSVPPHVKYMLQAEQPALLHAHFGVDALDAWPLVRALRLPMLVTLHGYDINTRRAWWEAGKGGRKMRSYPKRLLALARQPSVGFIAVSEAIRRRAIEFGIPDKKTIVSYIGIDTDKFTTGSVPVARRSPRVLFVGRLVEKKGCRYLIEAMSNVQKVITDARLVIIGDGPLRQSLEQLAQELRVNADFCGSRPSSFVRQELDAARVLCLPSVTAESGDAEGFGLVLLEAQASGVPVITSAFGGTAEGMREGQTGFAFPEADVDRLEYLLSSALRSLPQDVSERARQFVVREFDIRRTTRSLELAYNDLSRTGDPVVHDRLARASTR
jgi:glycosyltransferase involved in cell wall biosynthesis